MNRKTDRPPPEFDSGEALPSGRELEKKLFHLSILYEVTRELSGLTEIKSILDAFLPLCMGPMGAASGFLLLDMDDKNPRCEVSARGMSESSGLALCGAAGQLSDKIFETVDTGESTDQLRVFRGKHLAREPLLPPDTQLLIAFPVGSRAKGLLGLGPRVDHNPYGGEEQELQLALVRNLMTVLQNGLAHEEIRQMGQRLAERNARLRSSLKEMAQTREELDQRAFQLQQLYDASVELSGLIETRPIMETFLLLILGAFSVQNGFLVVYDQEKDASEVVVRGLDDKAATFLHGAEMRSVTMGLFVSLKDRIPHIMESRWITDQTLLERLPCAISAAVLFTIDEGCRGILGLGVPLKSGTYSKDEHRLMSLLLSQFMVSLDNARHFETVEQLNQDLERRNAELEATIKDLTTARVEIDLLQSARERILSLVQSEKERASRAVGLDFCIIVLVSVVLGFLFNMASPGRIPILPDSLFEEPPPLVSLEEAADLHRDGDAVFIDARPPEFYEQRHIQGAVNIPMTLFDFVYDMKLSQVDPGEPLVVYGRTFSRHYDTDVARKLTLLGHEKVYLLENGLAGWSARNNPTEE